MINLNPSILLHLLLGSLFCLSPHSVADEVVTEVSEPTESVVADQLFSASRVVFLGDSITYAGDYVVQVEEYLMRHDATPPAVINMGLPSETVSGLSEEGHANGKFPRPYLMDRLEGVLRVTQPDFVFACYGMNCGVYKPLNEERFAAYRDGIDTLRERLKQEGIPLVLITPVAFDGRVAAKKDNFEYKQYDDVLSHYGEYLLSLRDQSQVVIDVHAAFTATLESLRESDPDFTFQSDAVHPNKAGHDVIAGTIIDWIRGNSAVKLRESDTPQLAISKGALTERMKLLRNAYLSAAGHKRPGVAEGLPIMEAIEKASRVKTITPVSESR